MPPPRVLGEFRGAESGTGARRGELGLWLEDPPCGVTPCSGSTEPTKAPLRSRWDVGLWVLGISTAPRPPGRPRCRQPAGLSAREPLPGVSGEPRGSFSGSGPRCEVSGVQKGPLSCPPARPSTQALSESSWGTKNSGFRRAGPVCAVRFPLATPGSGPLPSPLKLGRQGRGAAPWAPRPAASHPPPCAPSALAWAGRGA